MPSIKCSCKSTVVLRSHGNRSHEFTGRCPNPGCQKLHSQLKFIDQKVPQPQAPPGNNVGLRRNNALNRPTFMVQNLYSQAPINPPSLVPQELADDPIECDDESHNTHSYHPIQQDHDDPIEWDDKPYNPHNYHPIQQDHDDPIEWDNKPYNPNNYHKKVPSGAIFQKPQQVEQLKKEGAVHLANTNDAAGAAQTKYQKAQQKALQQERENKAENWMSLKIRNDEHESFKLNKWDHHLAIEKDYNGTPYMKGMHAGCGRTENDRFDLNGGNQLSGEQKESSDQIVEFAFAHMVQTGITLEQKYNNQEYWPTNREKILNLCSDNCMATAQWHNDYVRSFTNFNRDKDTQFIKEIEKNDNLGKVHVSQYEGSRMHCEAIVADKYLNGRTSLSKLNVLYKCCVYCSCILKAADLEHMIRGVHFKPIHWYVFPGSIIGHCERARKLLGDQAYNQFAESDSIVKYHVLRQLAVLPKDGAFKRRKTKLLNKH